MEHCKRGPGKGTQDFKKNIGTQEERINGREEHLHVFIESDLVPIIHLHLFGLSRGLFPEMSS